MGREATDSMTRRDAVFALPALLGGFANSRPPVAIATALQHAQYESIRREVPMLLRVAGLNIAIIMLVCAHQKMPLVNYGWMTILLVYTIGRSMFLSRTFQMPVDPMRVEAILRTVSTAALGMIGVLGITAAVTFVAGTFGSGWLVPVSLCFGALSIAHCLYAIRPIAMGTLVLGIAPTAAALIVAGDFEARMLGLSMISVAALMLRFVDAQYRLLLGQLVLEKRNGDLANTDALTGLANRRAIMAALEAEAQSGNRFAVALIDLDGFKLVNDQLGHKFGDRLLCVVAERLCSATRASDEVGRLGGDEFVILFRTVVDSADVSRRADALLLELAVPVESDGKPLRFGASLGFAVSGSEGESVEELLHSADQALYAAKRDTQGQERSQRTVRLAA
jgi:diguanylate cyclase